MVAKAHKIRWRAGYLEEDEDDRLFTGACLRSNMGSLILGPPRGGVVVVLVQPPVRLRGKLRNRKLSFWYRSYKEARRYMEYLTAGSPASDGPFRHWVNGDDPVYIKLCPQPDPARPGVWDVPTALLPYLE